MDFASKIEHLQAFVHTSTYYVNNYMPRNSLVMEKIYPMPLQLDGKSVGYGEFVPAVMTMQPEDAEKATQRIMQVGLGICISKVSWHRQQEHSPLACLLDVHVPSFVWNAYLENSDCLRPAV